MFAAKNSCANEVYIYTFSRLGFIRLSLVGLRGLHLAFVAILAARYTSSLYEYLDLLRTSRTLLAGPCASHGKHVKTASNASGQRKVARLLQSFDAPAVVPMSFSQPVTWASN